MRKQTLLAAAIAAIVSASPLQAEETPSPKAKYNEPTRGFFLEHANVAGNKKGSVDLHSGSDGIDSGGGVRLGLGKAELIFNSGLRSYDVNEAMVKFAMPDIKSSEESTTSIHWSLVGGLAHLELENDDGDTYLEQTNIKLGAAATINADAATFTLAPRLVIADSDYEDNNPGTGKQDDTFVEVDLGAYVGIIDTQSGLFSLGVEALFTSEDDRDDSFAFGGRWLYNERLTLDVVPVVFSDGDQLGLPGLVRVNVSF